MRPRSTSKPSTASHDTKTAIKSRQEITDLRTDRANASYTCCELQTAVADEIKVNRSGEFHQRGIQCLQDCGLLKREMPCPKCESNMSLCRSANSIDKYRWKCGKGP
jgi:hypothetical protein